MQEQEQPIEVCECRLHLAYSPGCDRPHSPSELWNKPGDQEVPDDTFSRRLFHDQPGIPEVEIFELVSEILKNLYAGRGPLNRRNVYARQRRVLDHSDFI